MSLNSEMNSLQDGTIEIDFACREVFLRRGRIDIEHPVYWYGICPPEKMVSLVYTFYARYYIA